jgi:hypothetical protein
MAGKIQVAAVAGENAERRISDFVVAIDAFQSRMPVQNASDSRVLRQRSVGMTAMFTSCLRDPLTPGTLARRASGRHD